MGPFVRRAELIGVVAHPAGFPALAARQKSDDGGRFCQIRVIPGSSRCPQSQAKGEADARGVTSVGSTHDLGLLEPRGQERRCLKGAQ